MKKRISHMKLLIATAAMLVLSCSQSWGTPQSNGSAGGLVLVPGTYATHWEIPEFDKTPSMGFPGVGLNVGPYSRPSEIKSKPSLASAHPIWGNLSFPRSFRTGMQVVIVEKSDDIIMYFVLDESQGTGTGYDTIYVDTNMDTDFSRAQKTMGIRRTGVGVDTIFSSAVTVPVNRVFPSSGNSNLMKLDLYFQGSTGTGGKPEVGVAETRGCFVGEVESNQGKIPFRLIPLNADMRYDGISELLTPGAETVQSVVLFDTDRSGRYPLWLDDDRVFCLSSISNIAGQLYSLKSDRMGSKLEINSYSGPVSSLSVHLVPIGRVQEAVSIVNLAGRSAIYRAALGGRPIIVPAGQYRVINSTLRFPMNTERVWSLDYEENKRFTLEEGNRGFLSIGGDLNLCVASGRREIVLKGPVHNFSIPSLVPVEITTSTLGHVNGSPLFVDRNSDVGGGEIAYFLKDNKGKLVPLDKAARFLAPGKHKLVVTINVGPFGGILQAGKLLIVK